MAIREIRLGEDEILRKVSKPVKNFDEKLAVLLDDMYETMKFKDGVGLAAPQVGILRRAAVIDISDVGQNRKGAVRTQQIGKIELINPEIIEQSGEQTDNEGCLSFPDTWGSVTRPYKVTVRAQDRHGKWFKLTGEGLLARAICHETDHLDGHVFTEKVTEFVK